MRLFLASNKLGSFGNRLSELAGKNRKVLVIFNARDYKTPEERESAVKATSDILSSVGLLPEELDLRGYFGKNEALKRLIDELNPGCVFLDGGNTYLLATALHLSGMDKILRNDLAKDKYVYAGYSAGAMVASKNLGIFADSFGKWRGDFAETAEQLYGEVCMDGLGVIDSYIIPHMDREDFAVAAKKALVDVENAGLTAVPLNDTDVVIFNGPNTEILKK